MSADHELNETKNRGYYKHVHNRLLAKMDIEQWLNNKGIKEDLPHPWLKIAIHSNKCFDKYPKNCMLTKFG